MGVSENRGPKYSTLNSRILIIGTPNKVPLLFGSSHVATQQHVALIEGFSFAGPSGCKRRFIEDRAGYCRTLVEDIVLNVSALYLVTMMLGMKACFAARFDLDLLHMGVSENKGYLILGSL